MPQVIPISRTLKTPIIHCINCPCPWSIPGLWLVNMLASDWSSQGLIFWCLQTSWVWSNLIIYEETFRCFDVKNIFLISVKNLLTQDRTLWSGFLLVNTDHMTWTLASDWTIVLILLCQWVTYLYIDLKVTTSRCFSIGSSCKILIL